MGSKQVQSIMDQWDTLHELYIQRDKTKKSLDKAVEEREDYHEKLWVSLREHHSPFELNAYTRMIQKLREALQKEEQQIYTIEVKMGIRLPGDNDG